MIKYSPDGLHIKIETENAAAEHELLIDGIMKSLRLMACTSESDRRYGELQDGITTMVDLLRAILPNEFGLEKANNIME